jgi:hypothetical protein
MSSHAKPRRRLTAVTSAALTKPRRWLTVLAAAAVVAPGLALLASSTPANASIPANPRWESSAPFGTWNTGKFDLYNNEWNTSAAGPQTIWGDSYKHWGVQSTQPDSTSVKTYPSVQENYTNTTLGSLHALWSNYAERMPLASSLDAEAAYDIWLNNYSIEVMVWVDNHGQRPAGNVIATANIYGKKFTVWQSGSSMFTFALQGTQKQRGKVHLLKTMNWLASHGYLSPSDSLTQVNFGWEICSTDGTPMNFTVTNYSLTTRR